MLGSRLSALVAAAIVLAPLAAHANLIADGDFSQPSLSSGFVTYTSGQSFAGWTVIDGVNQSAGGGSIDVVSNSLFAAPPNGGQAADLDGSASEGGLTQSFATTNGSTYAVSFYLSGNPAGGPDVPNGGPTLKQVEVTIDGVAQSYGYDVVAEGNTLANMLYLLEGFDFTADSATTTLSFASLDSGDSSYGPVIADVAVDAVDPPDPIPEPTSLVLLATFIGGLGLSQRCRRDRAA